jgi:hypothetical protein
MNCFVVQMGCRYEGGSVCAASLSYMSARMKALEMVAAEQLNDDEIWDGRPAEDRPDRWLEKEPDFWTNDLDFVSVTAFELLPVTLEQADNERQETMA